jgi:hypothetical protein
LLSLSVFYFIYHINCIKNKYRKKEKEIMNYETVLKKVTKLIEDLAFVNLMRGKAVIHGVAAPIIPLDVVFALNELEKELCEIGVKIDRSNTPEQWKSTLEKSLHPIIHWLNNVKQDLLNRINAKYTDNSESLLESIKSMLFKDTNTFAQFETWVGDGHALIFKDADGQEYRLTVTREEV